MKFARRLRPIWPRAWRPLRPLHCALAIGFALAPGVAYAHVPEGVAGGFGSGFSHPLFGLDHFLAMLAVGLWGAAMGGRSVWTLPVTFPMIMAVGGLVGMAGVAIPHVETGVALSVLALGVAIAAAWAPAEPVALALVGSFALCHGYAHGVELPRAVDPAAYAVGFVVATGLIHVAGIGVGLGLLRLGGVRLLRALGGLIALAGGWFLAA